MSKDNCKDLILTVKETKVKELKAELARRNLLADCFDISENKAYKLIGFRMIQLPFVSKKDFTELCDYCDNLNGYHSNVS